jgi:hypothetical protein
MGNEMKLYGSLGLPVEEVIPTTAIPRKPTLFQIRGVGKHAKYAAYCPINVRVDNNNNSL